jgi:trk system potassium uptake protein TrkA
LAERSAKAWAFGPRAAEADPSVGKTAAVLGLGRFGGAVASELVRLGYDVLGIDDKEAAVQYYAPTITHVVQADITNVDALRQLGVDEVSYAIVAVGSDLEASILATAALDELGLSSIWAKAVTKQHGRILQRVGAHHVVYPEHDMGHQVAHMLGGRILDWFQLDEQFALVETAVPSDIVGKTIVESGVREKHHVTIVCVKPAGGAFTYATANMVLRRGDVLVAAGETAAAEAFARLS